MGTKEQRELERKHLREKRTLMQKALWKKLLLLLLAAAAMLGVWFLTKSRAVSLPAATLRVYFLDVGQGDAALLQTDSHSILIDGGESESGMDIVQMLRSLDIRRLDGIINSHPHSDHIGGIVDVLEQVPVDALYLPQTTDTQDSNAWAYENVLEIATEKQIPVYTPACCEKLSLGAAELEFLLVNAAESVDLNDSSLVCRVTCGERRFLFTGDLGASGEEALLNAGYALSADVLKVGHHGSGASTTPDFLAAVSPDYAVISCGARNDYGHPAQRVLDVLREMNCAIYRTDIDHTVLFETDGERISVMPDYHFESGLLFQ